MRLQPAFIDLRLKSRKRFFSGGNSGMGIFAAIMPTLLVAQAFYKHEGRQTTRGDIDFAILALVLSAVAIWISLTLQPLAPVEVAELKSLFSEGLNIMMTVVAVFALCLILITRLMLWSGLRGEHKKADRLAAKQARRG
ncbi:MAG: ABZJ_00895 family protein [Octadecabacter sp.]|nr:ABZJ_00895 family protein [Octadecabacter sp.]